MSTTFPTQPQQEIITDTFPRLPPELQRYILSIAAERSRTPSALPPALFRSTILRRTALVSRAWAEFSQYELFASERVVLEHVHCADKLLGVLEGNPSLAGLISRLSVVGGSKGGFDNSAYRLVELQRACPNLKELAIDSLIFALDALSSSKVLEYLDLEDVTILPSETSATATPTFPALRGLSLRRTWAGPSFSPLVQPSSLPSLKTLFIHGLGGDNTVCASLPAFRELESLRLGDNEVDLLVLSGQDLSTLEKLQELHIPYSSLDSTNQRKLLESIPAPRVLRRLHTGTTNARFLRGIDCVTDDTMITTHFPKTARDMLLSHGEFVQVKGRDWREPTDTGFHISRYDGSYTSTLEELKYGARMVLV
ncbi:hypothetical protein RQP46_005480 [Phenoliferia psychrophenolica]